MWFDSIDDNSPNSPSASVLHSLLPGFVEPSQLPAVSPSTKTQAGASPHCVWWAKLSVGLFSGLLPQCYFPVAFLEEGGCAPQTLPWK